MSQISFFVSSTFKDMQGERDALHRIVMPEIREFAGAYGRSVDFVDLRWGISTDNMEDDKSSDKILSVCLDEIEECSPYQIVILGERYGWIPSSKQMEEAAGKKNFYLEKEGISITELEILYGMWKNQGHMEKCIFCMREQIDSSLLSEEEKSIYLTTSLEDKERMDKLKNMIYQTPGAHILTYSIDMDKKKGRYDDFIYKIKEKIRELLEKEWGENKKKSWIEREFEEEKMITRQLAECFRGREKELDEFEKHIVCKFIISSGREGSGISSIMAKLGERFEKKGYRTANIYCGNGYCWNTEQLLKIMCAHIEGQEAEEEYGSTTPGFGERKKWKEKRDKLAAYYKGEDIIFLIDGIHHLSVDEGVEKGEFLPSKGCSSSISFIITTNENTQINPLAVEKVGRWCDHLDISECSREDLREIILSKMKKEHKDIGEKVMKELLSHPLISNMLCMELILQDILVMDQRDFKEIQKLEEEMDGNSAIDTYLCRLIQKHPKTERNLVEFWFIRALEILSEHDKEEINYLYYMLAGLILSVNGLATQDMAAMSEYMKENVQNYQYAKWLDYWEEARFAKMRRYMGKMLHKTIDGRYRFSHGQIRAALFKNKDIKGLIGGPLSYYESLPDESVIKQENMIVSFLVYITGRGEQEIRSIWDPYCFSFINRQYSLIKDENREISLKGRQRVERMINGVKTSLSYGYGTTFPNNLFLLLRMKAEDGVTLMEDELKFFVNWLAEKIKKTNEYERSILLSEYISMAIGYEKWMMADEKYKKPEEKRFRNYIGRFKEWSNLQRRALMSIYTNACEIYHELRMFINKQENVIVPKWDWDTLRDKTAYYINVLSNDTDVIRNYYCSKIMLMDTDRILLKDKDKSTHNIILSEKFARELMGSKYKKEDPATQFVIKCYVNAMLDITKYYVGLARSVEGKIEDKTVHSVYHEANYTWEKMIRKLKQRKYIKEDRDLELELLAKYCVISNEAGFYYNKERRQFYIDGMWETQKDMRKIEKLMNQPSAREEIKNGGVVLMECLLQGYVPSSYQKDNESKAAYVLSLLDKEGVYMLAKGASSAFVENIYYHYLIRALFEMDGVKEKVSGGEEDTLHMSIQSIEEYLEKWKAEDGIFIFKLKWLLQWYKNLEKKRNLKDS